jgi:hypothetical protein
MDSIAVGKEWKIRSCQEADRRRTLTSEALSLQVQCSIITAEGSGRASAADGVVLSMEGTSSTSD